MAKAYCKHAGGKTCKYYISKRFNMGFAWGSDMYCNHPREGRFIQWVDKCQLIKKPVDQEIEGE